MLDARVNDAFKVSYDPTIQGWHAGMTAQEILDQLSTIYGQATPAAIELNDVTFCGQYSAANAPKVLFWCIKNCTKIAIMGNNPYTNCQLTNNAICLLLTTGLYQRPFEEWDHLTNVQQMWIVLKTLIQEAFQRHLNATAPMAGHHRYAPAQSFQQNAFGALANKKDDDESIAITVVTQVSALMYQSQSTQTTTANTIQCQEQQMAQIAAAQGATHDTLHHVIAQSNTLLFNASNAGHRHYVGCD